MRDVIALLPMKAHSERVPGKNFRMLAGRPLFQWILDELLKVDAIRAVVINTDAGESLRHNGLVESDRVVVRDREPELCGDMVSMNLILENDIENVPASTYLMTHTTNPLLTAETIDRALDAYREGVATKTCDSLFTVTKFQTRFYREDGTPVNHDPENLIRTQDLEPWFEENSNLYVFSAESFSATRARIGAKPLLFETPKIESIDIDDQSDWVIAEAVAARR